MWLLPSWLSVGTQPSLPRWVYTAVVSQQTTPATTRTPQPPTSSRFHRRYIRGQGLVAYIWFPGASFHGGWCSFLHSSAAFAFFCCFCFCHVALGCVHPLLRWHGCAHICVVLWLLFHACEFASYAVRIQEKTRRRRRGLPSSWRVHLIGLVQVAWAGRTHMHRSRCSAWA